MLIENLGTFDYYKTRACCRIASRGVRRLDGWMDGRKVLHFDLFFVPCLPKKKEETFPFSSSGDVVADFFMAVG
jgi:hypothetical protein